MSQAEVQQLHGQLRRLRGQLPEFLQTVTSLDDAKDSRTAFCNIAKSLDSWMQETKSFVENYQQIKSRIDQQPPAKQEPGQVEEDQQLGLQMDSGLDSFANDFFDLT